MNKEFKELLELQNKYRNGIIKEEDIPEDKLEKLKNLYKTQIKLIEDSIEKEKQEIIKIKKKIEGNY